MSANLLNTSTSLPQWLLGQVLGALSSEDVLTTSMNEGRGKSITKHGEFVRLIMNNDGFHYNDPEEAWYDRSKPKWEVLDNELDRPDGYIGDYDTRSPELKHFGLHVVGLPGQREVYKYNFKRNKLGPPDANNRRCPMLFEDESDFFYLKRIAYLAAEEDANTSDGLPVRLEYLLIVRITNPYLALHKSVDWFVQLQAYANRVARSFVGEFTSEDLYSETNATAIVERERENFSNRIRALTNRTLDENETEPAKGTKQLIGVTIDSAELQRFVPTGENVAKHQEKLLEVFDARRESAAKNIRTDATAYETRTTKQAEADGILAIAKATAKGNDLILESFAKQPQLAGVKMATDALAQGSKSNWVLGSNAVMELAAAKLGIDLVPKP